MARKLWTCGTCGQGITLPDAYSGTPRCANGHAVADFAMGRTVTVNASGRWA